MRLGTEHLTEIFDASFEANVRKTKAGMAFFAGTGPADLTCGDCQFYGKGCCSKYQELRVEWGRSFGKKTSACKYFLLNDDPIKREYLVKR